MQHYGCLANAVTNLFPEVTFDTSRFSTPRIHFILLFFYLNDYHYYFDLRKLIFGETHEIEENCLRE